MIGLYQGPFPVRCPLCRKNVELIEYPPPPKSGPDAPPLKRLRTAPFEGLAPGATSGDAETFLQAMSTAEDVAVAAAAQQALTALHQPAAADSSEDEVFGPEPALVVAARAGQLDEVRALLDRGEEGFDVNAIDVLRRTALMEAAQGGHMAIMIALLAVQGIDVNLTEGNGATALMMAAQLGHTEIVAALLASGCDVNTVDNDGDTALMLAAHNGHTETVAALLASGCDVNAADNDGATALMFPAQEGYTEIVAALLASGCNVNAAYNDGATALTLAAHNGHTEIVVALLAV